MTTVTPHIDGLHLNQHELKDLEYADDTTLLSSSMTEATQAVSEFQHQAGKLGLEVSWPKTKLLQVGSTQPPRSVNIGGHDVSVVDQFIYLGSTLTNSGDMKNEVCRRRALASVVMKSLWKPLWRHTNISLTTKIRVYRAVVLSVLFYGAETWPLTKAQTSQLSGFDTRAQRSVCNIRWPELISNNALRQLTGLPPLARTLAQSRLRWFGHLMRTSPTHPTKIAWEFSPEAAGWRRPRGAPRLRFRDVVRDDLRNLGITPETAVAESADRTKWRRVVTSVVSTPARHET